MRLLFTAAVAVLLADCATAPEGATPPVDAAPIEVELQGHRGCRGLLPENTWPAFQHAMDLGVTALEMDVVLSADSQLIVSHEPWINADICAWPDSTTEDPHRYNIHTMTAAQVSGFACGTFAFERFPEQRQVATFKPVFNDVLDSVVAYSTQYALDLPGINVEIKSRSSWEPHFQPAPEVYVDAFLRKLDAAAYSGRVTVQSFDPRILIALHAKRPELELVYLTENPLDSPDKAVETLGFTPAVYSPAFQWVTARTRGACTRLGMELVVWTVNAPQDMEKLVALGVDGIITDYPNRFVAFANEDGITIR